MMPKPQRTQAAWDPQASIEWKVEWHRGRLRAVLANAEGRYHPYMIDRAKRFLAMNEREQRKTLWPHGEPA